MPVQVYGGRRFDCGLRNGATQSYAQRETAYPSTRGAKQPQSGRRSTNGVCW
jgi:hypothetical protein